MKKTAFATARRLIPLLLVAFLFSTPAWAQVPGAGSDDPFHWITDLITKNAKTWAECLIIVGALGVSYHYYMGSAQSGEKARNFFWGSIFALLAGFGTLAYDKLDRIMSIWR